MPPRTVVAFLLGGAVALASRTAAAGSASTEASVSADAAESSGNDARFVSQKIPKRMSQGGWYPLEVSMKNTGTTTWTARGGYLLSFDGRARPDEAPASVRLDAGDAVAPGQTKTFSFMISYEGTSVFRWKMAQSGETFGARSPDVVVTRIHLHGMLDAADCRVIAGWASDSHDHIDKVRVAILADGTQFALVTANAFRQDLAQAGEGKGNNAFFLATPAFLQDGKPHEISAVVIPPGDRPLIGSPKSIMCTAPTSSGRE